MQTFETPNGKVIQLVRCPKTAHIKVQFATGGELPLVLSGLYTSERAAITDVGRYLETLKVKAEKASTKANTKED
jgi:hypothetical protein